MGRFSTAGGGGKRAHDPASLDDEEVVEARRTAIRANHMELNMNLHGQAGGSLASTARMQIASGSTPLPGEGEATVDLTADQADNMAAMFADQFGTP